MITDTMARKIASEWHGGGGTSLYVFSSTGAILSDLLAEVDAQAEIESARIESCSDAERVDVRKGWQELISLQRYIERHGNRGPQETWATLTW